MPDGPAAEIVSRMRTRYGAAGAGREGPVWMQRKGQRVRFYDQRGQQVGPEQRNVGPAVAYAYSVGWMPADADLANVWIHARYGGGS